jgi:hypothetical protein
MTSYYYPLSDAYIVTAIKIGTKHINSITLYCLLLLILILTLLYVTKFNINIEIYTKHCLKLFFNFKFALRKFMQHIPCAEQPGARRAAPSRRCYSIAQEQLSGFADEGRNGDMKIRGSAPTSSIFGYAIIRIRFVVV